MRSWLTAGRVLAWISVLLVVVMQAVAGQWFPPPISISQYGVGPWGWIFSVWVVSLASAPVCTQRALTPGSMQRLACTLLLLGLLGTVVMAIVRTDADGAQTSVNAKVHLIGAIACLGFLPLGMLAAMWPLGPRSRRLAALLTTLIATSLALLLLAAAGINTAGLDTGSAGAPRSWAFWQAVAVVLCIVMVLAFDRAAHAHARRRPG